MQNLLAMSMSFLWLGIFHIIFPKTIIAIYGLKCRCSWVFSNSPRISGKIVSDKNPAVFILKPKNRCVCPVFLSTYFKAPHNSNKWNKYSFSAQGKELESQRNDDKPLVRIKRDCNLTITCFPTILSMFRIVPQVSLTRYLRPGALSHPRSPSLLQSDWDSFILNQKLNFVLNEAGDKHQRAKVESE